jgi:hypothetical protein
LLDPCHHGMTHRQVRIKRQGSRDLLFGQLETLARLA